MKDKNTKDTIVVEQKPLFSILSAMQPICTKRTALDATASIFFDVGPKELVLKSTDLEISLQASCTLEQSSLEKNKQLLVSGKRIFEIIKELEGPINCTFEKHQITFQSEGIRLALNIKESDEFPPFPERIENILHVDSKLLLNLLESVSFLIPQNHSNPALNGLLLEVNADGLIMTTTDGHCLAQATTKRVALEQSYSWLLPRRAIFELKKVLQTSPDGTVFLGTCGSQLVFSGELFNFFTKVLADKFPQYQSILDRTSFIPATMDKSKFVKTLRRSTCLLSGQFMATEFAFEPGQLQVELNNKEVGALKETLSIEAQNLDMAIKFYSPYLLNGLQSIEGKEVTCYLKSNTSPIIFHTTQIDYEMTYLVMPVLPSVNG